MQSPCFISTGSAGHQSIGVKVIPSVLILLIERCIIFNLPKAAHVEICNVGQLLALIFAWLFESVFDC